MICCLIDALCRLINRRRTVAPAPVAEPDSEPGPDPEPPFWLTPTPRHVLERLAPLHGEDAALVRPYELAETTLQIPIVRERRQKAARRALGYE
ncbi:hypothetical protein ACWF94_12200 [Streptomyces sp. NPDC055078]